SELGEAYAELVSRVAAVERGLDALPTRASARTGSLSLHARRLIVWALCVLSIPLTLALALHPANQSGLAPPLLLTAVPAILLGVTVLLDRAMTTRTRR